MNNGFSSLFTGGSFVAAALMYWLGWLLLPMRNDTCFEPGVFGLSAMALTMGLPDQMSYYLPIFHVLIFWMLAAGVVLFQGGAGVPRSNPEHLQG